MSIYAKYALDVNPIMDFFRMHHVDTLYHVNTFITSIAFLQKQALLSREYCENNNFTMSTQQTDVLDMAMGIYNLIFLNFIDLHKQANTACSYGPVSFEFSSDILRSNYIDEVYITKTNPIYWNGKDWKVYTMPDHKEHLKYLLLANHEGNKNYSDFCADFGHMLMIRTKKDSGVLPFERYLKKIVIDETHGNKALLKDNEENKNNLTCLCELSEKLDINVIARTCPTSCGCKDFYKKEPFKYC